MYVFFYKLRIQLRLKRWLHFLNTNYLSIKIVSSAISVNTLQYFYIIIVPIQITFDYTFFYSK